MPDSFAITALWKLAWRNVFRNRRRTLLSMSVLVFSTSVLILYGGFRDYMYWGMRETAIFNEYGHFQIYRKGFLARQDELTMDGTLGPNEVKAILDILQKQTEVIAAVPRIKAVGLASNGRESMNVFMTGSLLSANTEFNAMLPMIGGYSLSEEDQGKAVIGADLLRKLSLEPGEIMTVVAQTLDGSINAVDLEIAGVFRSGNKFLDRTGVILSLSDTQFLLDTDRVQRITVLLRDTKTSGDVYRRIRNTLVAAVPGIETAFWEDLAVEYRQVVLIYDTIFRFGMIVILVICVLSISNSLMMSVMERTREIGTMLALGVSKARAAAMILEEGLILGMVGAGIGTIVAMALAAVISHYGIDIPPPPGYSRGFTIRINIVYIDIVLSIGVAIGSSLFASGFAVAKALRMDIAESLRFV